LQLDKLVSAADLDLAVEAQVKAHPILAWMGTDARVYWQQLRNFGLLSCLLFVCASVLSRHATEQWFGCMLRYASIMQTVWTTAVAMLTSDMLQRHITSSQQSVIAFCARVCSSHPRISLSVLWVWLALLMCRASFSNGTQTSVVILLYILTRQQHRVCKHNLKVGRRKESEGLFWRGLLSCPALLQFLQTCSVSSYLCQLKLCIRML